MHEVISPQPRNLDAGALVLVFARRTKSIVVTKLCNEQFFRTDFVYQPMFVVDSPGPIAGEVVLKRLWFSNAIEWRALNIFNELVDALEGFLVGALPKQVVFPGVLGKDEPHSESARSLPSPRSN